MAEEGIGKRKARGSATLALGIRTLLIQALGKAQQAWAPYPMDLLRTVSSAVHCRFFG